MKKRRAANKKLVTGSSIWLILLGEINYSIEPSLGKEVSTNGFLHSKGWLKAKDGICSMNIKLQDS